jgi:LacI family transcriptional regulator
MSRNTSTRVTLKEIARRAGCSTGVVGKVLNRNKGNILVGDALRKKVLRIAEELGYAPNHHARMLAKQRAQAVGLIYGMTHRQGLFSSFWAQVLSGIDAVLSARDYDIVLVSAHRAGEELRCGMVYLAQRRIDALILVGDEGIALHSLGELAGPESRLVIAPATREWTVPHVQVDHAPGLQAAVRYLAELGHREVLWVGVEDSGVRRAVEREQTVHTAAGEVGMHAASLWLSRELARSPVSRYLAGDSHEQLLPHFRESDPPTAIIAYNESVALALYQVLARQGYRVPEDVSVIGYDDIFATSVAPPMTVVSHKLCAVGEAAARAALARIEEPAGSRELALRHTVSSELVIRQSTAAPRPGRA